MTPTLTFAPPPYADEAPSSWIGRIASRYGAAGFELAAYLKLTAKDLDVLSDQDVQVLAAATGRPQDEVQELARQSALGVRADIVAHDIDTGLKGVVCSHCLAEDEADGRDHYVRAAWVNAWTITCLRHHAQLRDYQALHLQPGRDGGIRKARVTSLFEEITHPSLTHRLKPVRVAGSGAPASQLVALQELLTRRTGYAEGAWTSTGPQHRLRVAARDLAMLLLSHHPKRGWVLDCFEEMDGVQHGYRTGQTARAGALRSLDANRRAALLTAIATMFLEPHAFQTRALHGWGAKHFFSMQDISPHCLDRAPHLCAAAVQDPLSLAFLIATLEDADRVLRRLGEWPAGLRRRAEHAAYLVLAVYGYAGDRATVHLEHEANRPQREPLRRNRQLRLEL